MCSVWVLNFKLMENWTLRYLCVCTIHMSIWVVRPCCESETMLFVSSRFHYVFVYCVQKFYMESVLVKWGNNWLCQSSHLSQIKGWCLSEASQSNDEDDIYWIKESLEDGAKDLRMKARMLSGPVNLLVKSFCNARIPPLLPILLMVMLRGAVGRRGCVAWLVSGSVLGCTLIGTVLWAGYYCDIVVFLWYNSVGSIFACPKEFEKMFMLLLKLSARKVAMCLCSANFMFLLSVFWGAI